MISISRPELRSNPWYHERKGPDYFNAWTVTHAAWGAVASGFIPFTGALILHTLYETIEQDIFPLEDRDISLRNHVGDTLGFVAGYLAGRRFL